MGGQPFVGSAALAAGPLNRYQLRRLHRLMPNVYLDNTVHASHIQHVGWTHIKVLREHRDPDVIQRVRRAWDSLSQR